MDPFEQPDSETSALTPEQEPGIEDDDEEPVCAVCLCGWDACACGQFQN